jgi:hypothetical protein
MVKIKRQLCHRATASASYDAYALYLFSPRATMMLVDVLIGFAKVTNDVALGLGRDD